MITQERVEQKLEYYRSAFEGEDLEEFDTLVGETSHLTKSEQVQSFMMVYLISGAYKPAVLSALSGYLDFIVKA